MGLTSNLCSQFKPRERGFWGTFATPELEKAIEAGYRVLDVAENWSWSRCKRSTSLFKDYIDTSLKIKMEASGWPSERCCETEPGLVETLCSHEEKYLNDIRAKGGIKLDLNSIEKNEGLLIVAKIFFGEFLGLFGNERQHA